MTKPYDSSRFSWKARAMSFKYAFNGIKTLLRSEHNARIHAVATIAVIIAGIYWNVSNTEWVAIICLIAAIFALEALNSAIEAIADKVSPEFDLFIKKAKDMAAAAVLFMAVAAFFVAIIIFLPKWIVK